MRYVALVPDPVIGRLVPYLDKASHPVEFQADSQADANQQAKAMRLPPAVLVLPDELRQSKHDQRAAGAARSRRGALKGGVVDSGRRRHTPPSLGNGRPQFCKSLRHEGNSTYERLRVLPTSLLRVRPGAASRLSTRLPTIALRCGLGR
jgi:hypothetical protein